MMSTMEGEKVEQNGKPPEAEEVVELQVSTDVGDSPPAGATQGVEAIQWFQVVRVETVGFEAFVRLPNDYQHRDIREKALAAKGRRIRQLKHPETDANVVLESELDAVAEGEGGKEAIIGELLAETYYRDRDDAALDVQEDEKWENIRQDQERWSTLSTTSVDDRSADEWRELTEHIAAYAKAIEERLDAIQKPRRELLEALDLNELVDKARDRRIEAESRRVFNDTYSFFQTYFCTLKLPEGFDPERITPDTMPRQRYFSSEQDLREYDSRVVAELREAFDVLENALANLTVGNS
jgi:hypothetical protein